MAATLATVVVKAVAAKPVADGAGRGTKADVEAVDKAEVCLTDGGIEAGQGNTFRNCLRVNFPEKIAHNPKNLVVPTV